MGTIFWIFSYFTTILSILLLALSIASALYLLTELTEEFPTATGKILHYLLYIVTILQIILWLDGLPTFESLAQLGSLGLYYLMLREFPFVEFLSFPTIGSMILFLFTNVLWLRYFLLNTYDVFSIIGFFITNVWVVPCGLFISLSINDNTLPGLTGQINKDNGIGGRRQSVFRTVFDVVYRQVVVIGGVLNPIKLLQDKRR